MLWYRKRFEKYKTRVLHDDGIMLCNEEHATGYQDYMLFAELVLLIVMFYSSFNHCPAKWISMAQLLLLLHDFN